MKIKTWELDRLKNGFDFHYSEDLVYLKKEIKQIIDISVVDVKGTADKMTDIYTVKGQVSAILKLQCSRCLTPFDYDLNNDFEEIFVPKNVETSWDQDAENLHLIESEEIDLTAIVEEAVILSIPYVPLCTEECQGLCPTCGINLNENTCECKNEKIDPRLADLAKWFDQNGIKE